MDQVAESLRLAFASAGYELEQDKTWSDFIQRAERMGYIKRLHLDPARSAREGEPSLRSGPASHYNEISAQSRLVSGRLAVDRISRPHNSLSDSDTEAAPTRKRTRRDCRPMSLTPSHVAPSPSTYTSASRPSTITSNPSDACSGNQPYDASLDGDSPETCICSLTSRQGLDGRSSSLATRRLAH